jgi:hypothetical protein
LGILAFLVVDLICQARFDPSRVFPRRSRLKKSLRTPSNRGPTLIATAQRSTCVTHERDPSVTASADAPDPWSSRRTAVGRRRVLTTCDKGNKWMVSRLGLSRKGCCQRFPKGSNGAV